MGMATFWKMFLTFSLLWSSLAGAASPFTQPQFDSIHQALHSARDVHHHHDDGGLHVDSSADSVQHVALDLLYSAVGIPSTEVCCALVEPGREQSRHRSTAWSPHHPEGLFRPPCLSI